MSKVASWSLRFKRLMPKTTALKNGLGEGSFAQKKIRHGYRTMGIFLCLGTLTFVGMAQATWTNYAPGLYSFVAQRFNSKAPVYIKDLQTSQLQLHKKFGIVLKRSANHNLSLNEQLALLKEVNKTFNKVPYYLDAEHWNQTDYWATPIEFFASWGGDCEDYAIAKYMSLKELGIPSERLRITYVRAIQIGEPHMVLAYYPNPNADPYILDNLKDDILLGSQRSDLKPIYGFNDDDIVTATGITRKGGASTVRLWREVQLKMMLEEAGKFDELDKLR